jgi:hypothetical protein
MNARRRGALSRRSALVAARVRRGVRSSCTTIAEGRAARVRVSEPTRAWILPNSAQGVCDKLPPDFSFAFRPGWVPSYPVRFFFMTSGSPRRLRTPSRRPPTPEPAGAAGRDNARGQALARRRNRRPLSRMEVRSALHRWSAVESYTWSPSHDQCGMLRPFGTSSADWW